MTENIILNIIPIVEKMVRYMDGLCFGKFMIKKKVFLFLLARIKKIVKYYYNRLVTRSRLEDSEYLVVNIQLDVLADINNGNIVLTVLNDIVGEEVPEDESEEVKIEQLWRGYSSDDTARQINNCLTENQQIDHLTVIRSALQAFL